MIQYIDETPSTNSLLRDLALGSPLEEGYTIVAQSQSAGRGQQGNSWESEAGKNLTFSLLLRPDFLIPSDHFLISQVVSIAIVEWLSQFSECFSIKWPNDIYYNDRKIAGILIENDWQSGCIHRSIVGVGININQTIFVSKAPNPVSLKQITGQDYSLETLMSQLHAVLMKEYASLKTGKVGDIKNRYISKMYRYNQLSCFTDNQGAFEAFVQGVLDDGRLRLQVLNEPNERLYYFKEVSWVVFRVES